MSTGQTRARGGCRRVLGPVAGERSAGKPCMGHWQTGRTLAWGAVQFACARQQCQPANGPCWPAQGLSHNFSSSGQGYHLGKGVSLLPLVIENSFMGRTYASAEGDPMCVHAGSLLLGWAHCQREVGAPVEGMGLQARYLIRLYRQGIGSCVCVVWQWCGRAWRTPGWSSGYTGCFPVCTRNSVLGIAPLSVQRRTCALRVCGLPSSASSS